MKRLYNWKVVKEVPIGWIENKNTTTIPIGYRLYNNGKSLFSGERESVLIKKEESHYD
jgi:hypothetical protein